MPVFLSHKREDKQKALAIAAYLERQRVKCYVDEFDPELKSTDDITETLVKRVGQCSHVMAVVSEYTKESWWVPFEIGIGTEKDRRITSYQLNTQVKLPDFLTKWPVMKRHSDLDIFVAVYKRDNSNMIEMSEPRGYHRDITSADKFHNTLKAQLRPRTVY